MIRCLDIHTHHPAPQPQAVVAMNSVDFFPVEFQKYSVGIHPWDSGISMTQQDWANFQITASMPPVVAIGECGIDKLKGAPLYKQMLIFKNQIEISEKIKKPLIIHDVKAHDVIVGIKKDLNPSQKWLVHGFRGKPTVAKMLTDAGIYLSFGEKFNNETLKTVPRHMILAETDDSMLSIEEIIANMSEVYGEDLTETVAINTSAFLFDAEIISEDDEIV